MESAPEEPIPFFAGQARVISMQMNGNSAAKFQIIGDCIREQDQ
jgi:hypothetical protein